MCSSDHMSPRLSMLLIPCPCERLEIVAAGNGLLLCCPINKKTYFVHNPTTRQWLALPPKPGRSIRLGREMKGFVIPVRKQSRSSSWPSSKSDGGLVARLEHGLPVHFKVVMPKRSPGYSGHGENAVVFCFDIFCSEAGEWTRINAHCSLSSPLYPSYWFLIKPFILNGILHWPSYPYGFVAAYDPHGNEDTCLHFINLPDSSQGDEHSTLCGVSCGRLQHYEVLKIRGNLFLKVWGLHDYDRGEWLLKHAYEWNDVWSNDDYLIGKLSEMRSSCSMSFQLISFHPFNSNVKYQHNREFIVIFHIQNKRLDILCCPSSDFRGISWWLLMPFVPSPWPTPLPQLNHHWMIGISLLPVMVSEFNNNGKHSDR